MIQKLYCKPQNATSFIQNLTNLTNNKLSFNPQIKNKILSKYIERKALHQDKANNNQKDFFQKKNSQTALQTKHIRQRTQQLCKKITNKLNEKSYRQQYHCHKRELSILKNKQNIDNKNNIKKQVQKLRFSSNNKENNNFVGQGGKVIVNIHEKPLFQKPCKITKITKNSIDLAKQFLQCHQQIDYQKFHKDKGILIQRQHFSNLKLSTSNKSIHFKQNTQNKQSQKVKHGRTKTSQNKANFAKQKKKNKVTYEKNVHHPPKSRKISRKTSILQKVQLQCSFQSENSIENVKVNNNVVKPVKKPLKFTNHCLQNEYQKGKLLGKGYFGQVYLGLHKATGLLCALKYLSLDRIKEEKNGKMIQRQIECQLALKHPNICQIYEYFIDDKNLVLVIQFCDGDQLYKKMKYKRRFNQQQTCEIIYQVCQAIHYIHQNNIIHRDIKPQNLLLTSAGTIKVCDFGWAIQTTCSRKTLCGTPLYSSPQLVSGREYDKRIDIWAIGVLTYEMLVGLVPFKVYGEHQLVKIVQDELNFPTYLDISQNAKNFIIKILTKDPEDRINLLQIMNHPFLQQRNKIIQRVSNIFPQYIDLLLLG